MPWGDLMSRLLRAFLVLLASGGLLLAGAVPASAHAVLVGATPAAGSVVAVAPAAVWLVFSEPVDVTSDALEVDAPDGHRVATPGGAYGVGNTAGVTLPHGLAVGTYEVRWHLVARDGHPSTGTFRFAVRVPSASLTAANGGSSGPSPVAATGRALAAGGSLALVGLVLFPVLVLGPASRRLAGRASPDAVAHFEAAVLRRLRTPARVAAVLAATGTVLVLAETTATASGRSALTELAHPVRVLGVATTTRTGMLLLFRLLAATVALVLLAGPRRRLGARQFALPRAAIATGAVAGLLLTFSLSSHAGAAADGAVAIPLDVAHLLAAGVWTGGLLALALAGLPAAHEIGRRDVSLTVDAAGVVAARFSVLAQAAMVGLLATGAYAVMLRVTALRDLGTTAWGGELVTKLALWVTVLLIAAGNAAKLVPALADRVGARMKRQAAAAQLASAVRLELGLAGTLVALAAVLSATAPPEQDRAGAVLAESVHTAPAVTSSSALAQGYRLEVQAVRSRSAAAAGTVFAVGLSVEGEAANAPGASGTLAGADGVAHPFALQLVGAGQWSSQRLEVPPGQYRLTAQFDRASGSVRIPVTVRVG
ncbi:MAG: transporter [Frankiales bacterium]|nr:transporter [Frankiales bacterium]